MLSLHIYNNPSGWDEVQKRNLERDWRDVAQPDC